jgi:hypothetical protein
VKEGGASIFAATADGMEARRKGEGGGKNKRRRRNARFLLYSFTSLLLFSFVDLLRLFRR